MTDSYVRVAVDCNHMSEESLIKYVKKRSKAEQRVIELTR